MTQLSEENVKRLKDIFRIKSDDQKTTNQESLTVENQPEFEPETKTLKKGNMKRGKKA